MDVDPATWCISPDAVEAAITPRTKAIIATHIYGNLCDMDRLLDIGQRHGIPVIEDAAEAIGSVYHGKRAGSMGLFGVFSFHGTKTLTTGEGGMFATNDAALYERVFTLSNHGRARGETKQFWSERVGFKYKMSNIQAAIGCAQLERIDQLLSKKRLIFAQYQAALAPLVSVTAMNTEPENTVNSYWMPTLVFSKIEGFNRDTLLVAFKEQNIDGRVFFWPLSKLGVDGIPTEVNTPIAQWVSPRAINLPSYHDMTEFDVQRVAKVILDYYG